MTAYDYKRKLWWYKVRWAAIGALSGVAKTSIAVAFASPEARVLGSSAMWNAVAVILILAAWSAIQSVATFVAEYPAPPPEEITTTVTQTVTSNETAPKVTETVTTIKKEDA